MIKIEKYRLLWIMVTILMRSTYVAPRLLRFELRACNLKWFRILINKTLDELQPYEVNIHSTDDLGLNEELHNLVVQEISRLFPIQQRRVFTDQNVQNYRVQNWTSHFWKKKKSILLHSKIIFKVLNKMLCDTITSSRPKNIIMIMVTSNYQNFQWTLRQLPIPGYNFYRLWQRC